jgi:hypothetical protein
MQPAAGSAIMVAVLDTIGQNMVVCGELLTPLSASVTISGLSCVADGNCPRVA